jgi:polyhydroxybutyrate depolymerase
MIMKSFSIGVVMIALLTVDGFAQEAQRMTVKVDGVDRVALVHVPTTATSKVAPLVFGFHGHGGSMANAQRSFHFHRLWPEAVTVYPQGLNTVGKLTDPLGRKAGWSMEPEPGNKDLRFFDALLTELRRVYKIDASRIYSSGHSNGGGFTYLLWAMRPELFAAMAPSASAAQRVTSLLKPKPVLHLAGEKDPLVRYRWQLDTIEHLRKLNQCTASKAWDLDASVSIYPSAIQCPVLTAVHPGGHSYPPEAPAVIVKFFKSQVLPKP